MGKIDTITKEYIENPVIFADAFNQFLYHGEQRIDPTQLTELDTTELWFHMVLMVQVCQSRNTGMC